MVIFPSPFSTVIPAPAVIVDLLVPPAALPISSCPEVNPAFILAFISVKLSFIFVRATRPESRLFTGCINYLSRHLGRSTLSRPSRTQWIASIVGWDLVCLF